MAINTGQESRFIKRSELVADDAPVKRKYSGTLLEAQSSRTGDIPVTLKDLPPVNINRAKIGSSAGEAAYAFYSRPE